METWKTIPGFDGRYEASDLGRIRSLAYGKTRIMRQQCNRGYSAVSFSNPKITKYVHRLVLEAFVGPAPEGTEGCHRNGKKADNSLENLRWDTPKNNWSDNYRNGTAYGNKTLLLVGESLGKAAKLCCADVLRIREARLFGARPVDIEQAYGVSRATISGVLAKRYWRHL